MSTTRTQKGFSALEVIIVFVVIALLGFGGWYVWNKSKSHNPPLTTSKKAGASNTGTTEQASQTATYENKVLGFSFAYPKDWTKASDTTFVPARIQLTSPDYKLVDGTAFGEIETGGTLGVEVYDSANGHKDIYAYRDAENGSIYAVGTKGDGTTTDITLKGVPAVKGTACGHPTRSMDCVVFIKDGLFYWITYNRKKGESSPGAYAKEYQALLDSFKFD